MKFDPTDQEILEHLEAKVRSDIHKLHPLIDEFIPTLEGENGICYTHPEKLPGQLQYNSSKKSYSLIDHNFWNLVFLNFWWLYMSPISLHLIFTVLKYINCNQNMYTWSLNSGLPLDFSNIKRKKAVVLLKRHFWGRRCDHLYMLIKSHVFFMCPILYQKNLTINRDI